MRELLAPLLVVLCLKKMKSEVVSFLVPQAVKRIKNEQGVAI